MNRKIIVALFSTLILFNTVQSWRVTLYDSVHVTGNSIDITGDKECVNLDNDREYFNKKTSSIETHGTCVVLYDQYDCQSESLTIRPYTPNRQYLPNLNFNDKTSSIGPCLHTIEWSVTLYDNTYHTGDKFYYKGNEECVNLEGDREYFDNRASSANTHAGCVVLYDQFNCQSESVILSHYSTHHSELIKLNFNNKTSSIGPCLDTPEWMVTLYDNIKQTGDKFYYKGDEQCVNLKDDRKYFDNKASSANTHGGCVVLYDQFDCQSESVMLRPHSSHHGELGWLNFNDKTSSIGSCYYMTTRTIAPTTETEPITTISTKITIKPIGRYIRLRNNCPYTVWPGILGNTGKGQPENGGFELKAQQIKVITIENNWSGRIWGRTGCDDSGRCETGDCGNRIECSGAGGELPTTLIELSLACPDGVDSYDVSLVDGFNLPMSLVVTGNFKTNKNNNNHCGEAGCPFDLNTRCPHEFSFKSGERTVACNSACKQFNTDEYCCRGIHNTPQTCNSSIWPVNYPAVFKRYCPNAYSYPYDNQNQFTCRGNPLINYEITFCPSINKSESDEETGFFNIYIIIGSILFLISIILIIISIYLFTRKRTLPDNKRSVIVKYDNVDNSDAIYCQVVDYDDHNENYELVDNNQVNQYLEINYNAN